MTQAKKKSWRKTKIRESYREFVRKVIFQARLSIDNEEFVNLEKLKSLKSSLQEKLSELNGLVEEVLEY